MITALSYLPVAHCTQPDWNSTKVFLVVGQQWCFLAFILVLFNQVSRSWEVVKWVERQGLFIRIQAKSYIRIICDNEMLGNTVFMILYIQIVPALVN